MELYVECPHCDLPILIMKKDINCGIFRHGIIIESGKQMDPHTPEHICNFLASRKLIYGCGKPFRLEEDCEYQYLMAVKCDYI